MLNQVLLGRGAPDDSATAAAAATAASATVPAALDGGKVASGAADGAGERSGNDVGAGAGGEVGGRGGEGGGREAGAGGGGEGIKGGLAISLVRVPLRLKAFVGCLVLCVGECLNCNAWLSVGFVFLAEGRTVGMPVGRDGRSDLSQSTAASLLESYWYGARYPRDVLCL